MKITSTVLIVCLFLAGCSAATPQIVDNGHPGQIDIFIYLDSNNNGFLDAGEKGIQDRIGFAPATSCSSVDSTKITKVQTDTTGKATLHDLKPGLYCVFYDGSETTTTKLGASIYLSSDQSQKVMIGVMSH